MACEEAASAASRFASELSFEPGELRAGGGAGARASGAAAQARRRGRRAAGQASRRCAREPGELENADFHLAALAERVRELHASCAGQAESLHVRRVDAATGLARAVEAELAALHIPRARLEARVELLAGGQLGPRGSDRVEFLFTANPGEPLAPLTKVASGGELSRVLLAVKGVLATGDHVTTYVFDEVDAGVGGAVAEAIGRRLHAASQRRQVLAIHPPAADCRVRGRPLPGREAHQGRADDHAGGAARRGGAGRGDRAHARARGSAGTAREHASQLVAEAHRAARKTGAKKGRPAARTEGAVASLQKLPRQGGGRCSVR